MGLFATDLCILTSLPPAGLLCELVNDDSQGTMARRDDCRKFADRYDIPRCFFIARSMSHSTQMGNQNDQHRTSCSISPGTSILRVPFHFGSRRNMRGPLKTPGGSQGLYVLHRDKKGV